MMATCQSIEDSDLIELRPLTIFTGPNGSGKSNILEAIGVFAKTSRLTSGVEEGKVLYPVG